MADPQGDIKKFQWKWVWITLGMFVVFYTLPLVLATSVKGTFGNMILGGWLFGGVIVIAAVSAMLSKGVTILEPAVAGAFLTILWYVVYQILIMTNGLPLRLNMSNLIVVMIAIFGLSLLGAGLGEGIQNLRQKEKSADQPTGAPLD